MVDHLKCRKKERLSSLKLIVYLSNGAALEYAIPVLDEFRWYITSIYFYHSTSNKGILDKLHVLCKVQ